MSTSCETLGELLQRRAVSKSENLSDSLIDLDRILVIRALEVALRPMIDSWWTVVLSKGKSGGLSFVFWLSVAWLDLRRDKMRGSSNMTI